MPKVVELHRNKRFLKHLKTLIFLFPLIFNFFSFKVSGQDILNKKINLALQGASVKNALLHLQKQSGIKIIYGESINRYPEVKISVQASELTLKEAIELILKRTNLRYELMGNHVLISEKPSGKAPGPNQIGRAHV